MVEVAGSDRTGLAVVNRISVSRPPDPD